MAVPKRLKDFLTKARLKYATLKHPVAYTAQEIAAAQDVPGKQVLKTVVLKLNGSSYALAILPAIHLVDFKKAKRVLKVKKVELAKEKEIGKLFPDFEVGAMPPFPQLASQDKLPVYLDKLVKEDKEVVFNAGSHTDTIKLKTAALLKLSRPKLADLGIHVSKAK